MRVVSGECEVALKYAREAGCYGASLPATHTDCMRRIGSWTWDS